MTTFLLISRIKTHNFCWMGSKWYQEESEQGLNGSDWECVKVVLAPAEGCREQCMGSAELRGSRWASTATQQRRLKEYDSVIFIIFLFEIRECFNSVKVTVLRSAVFHVIWFIKKLRWHFVISHWELHRETEALPRCFLKHYLKNIYFFLQLHTAF